MGLTIHYTLKSKHQDATQAEQAVSKMRQLALDLPFEQVGDIVNLTGDQCDPDAGARTAARKTNRCPGSSPRVARASNARGTSVSAAL